jgi:hypothetical protein
MGSCGCLSGRAWTGPFGTQTRGSPPCAGTLPSFLHFHSQAGGFLGQLTCSPSMLAIRLPRAAGSSASLSVFTV